MATKVHPKQITGISSTSLDLDIQAIKSEIESARSGESNLSNRLTKLLLETVQDFKITQVANDAQNGRLVVSINGGSASINNIIVNIENTTFNIQSPAINTTYYVFLNANGTFTTGGSSTESNTNMLVGKVIVGASLTELSYTDERYFFTRGGGGNPEEVTNARTNNTGTTYNNLKSRLDAMDSATASVSSDVDAVETYLTGVSNDINSIQSDVSSIENSLNSLESSVADIETEISNATGGFSTLDARLDSIEANVGGGVAYLDDLQDVNTSNLTSGQALVWNGTSWVNQVVSGGESVSLNSPSFTGTPTAPTATTSDNSNQIATTSFVKAQGYVGSSEITALENTVNTLESKLTTFFSTFNDSFVDSTYINNSASTNLIRVTSGDQTFIRANRQYNVDVASNLSLDASSSSSISYTPSGGFGLTNGMTAGNFTSKFYDVNNTTQAGFDVNFSHQLADTFGNEETITTSGIQTSIKDFITLIDPSDGTRWYFYLTADSTDLFGWAVNNNGTVRMSHRQIGTNNTTSAGYTGNVNSLNAKLDKDGNVWIGASRYVTGSGHRLSVYRINKSNPSTTAYTDEFAVSNSGAVSLGIDVFYDSVTHRFHIICVASTAASSQLRIYDCSTNSLFYSRQWTNVNYTSGQTSVKLCANRDSNEMGIFIFLASSTTAVRSLKYNIHPTSGAYGGALGGSTVTYSDIGNRGNGEVFYLSGVGFLVVTVSDGGGSISFGRISSALSSASDYVALGTASISTQVIFSNMPLSAYFDETHIHVVCSSEHPENTQLYYTRIRVSDGLRVVMARQMTTNGINDNYPTLEFYNNTYTAYYVSETSAGIFSPRRIAFGQNSTKIKMEAQLEGETSWITVYDNNVSPVVDVRGNSLTLGTASKTKLRVRIEIKSPNGSTVSPTINSYQIWVPDNSLGETSATFISKSTFNDRSISKVKLTTEQDPKSGSIQWYMSNDGGLTWSPQITLGSEYAFPSVGGDLKVKAVLTIPSGSINIDSPRIDSYTLVTSNSVVQSDIIPIQINLARTNFRFAALQNATRYSMKNMVVDTFTDSTGINVSSSSNYTFDNTNKLVRATNTAIQCIVTAPTESLTVAPVSIFISSDVTSGTGSVTFEASRDGGTTWKAVTNEIVTNLNDITSGTNLVVRAKINGNATLNAWAYSWS